MVAIALNIVKRFCAFCFCMSHMDLRATEETAVRRNALTIGGVIAIHYFLFLLTVTKRKGLNHLVQHVNNLNYPP